MSRINAIRIINLNYNNNTIKISDELFELGGRNTLMSLANGGGKTVLIQVISALFMHGRKRDTTDRPFAGFFLSSKPTFIMVEWQLDYGAGYVLTGMMVRKNQNISEENANPLDIINFVSEYRFACNLDIKSIPVTEKNNNEVVLKSYGTCKQLFDSFKRDREAGFRYYDMNSQGQSRQYFDKLLEYQIDSREWENIIRKINLDESGLSKFFEDCKDERGLIEKWFLDAVENKLCKDKPRIREFQNIFEKYILQYKNNENKIKTRDAVAELIEKLNAAELSVAEYYGKTQERKEKESGISFFLNELKRLASERSLRCSESEEGLSAREAELERLLYEKISAELYKILDMIEENDKDIAFLGNEKSSIERNAEKIRQAINKLRLSHLREEADSLHEEVELCRSRRDLVLQENIDLLPERKRIGSSLKAYYSEIHNRYDGDIKKLDEEILKYKSERQSLRSEREEIAIAKDAVNIEEGRLISKKGEFDKIESRFNKNYSEDWHRNILGFYEDGQLDIAGEKLRKDIGEKDKALKLLTENKDKLLTEEYAGERRLQDLHVEKQKLSSRVEVVEQKLKEAEAELSERKNILRLLEEPTEHVFDTDYIRDRIDRRLKDIDIDRAKLIGIQHEKREQIDRLFGGHMAKLPEKLKELLEENGVTYVDGLDWLRKQEISDDEKADKVSANPFLPYSIIISERDLEKLETLNADVYSVDPIAIVTRENLSRKADKESDAIYRIGDAAFYVLFDKMLLSEKGLEKELSAMRHALSIIDERIAVRNDEYDKYSEYRSVVMRHEVTGKGYEELKKETKTAAVRLDEIQKAITDEMKNQAEYRENIRTIDSRLSDARVEFQSAERKLKAFEEFILDYENYKKVLRTIADNKRKKEELQNRIAVNNKRFEIVDESLDSAKIAREDKKRTLEENDERLRKFSEFEDGSEMISEDEARGLYARFEVITKGVSDKLEDVEQSLAKASKQYESKNKELQRMFKKYNLVPESIEEVIYSIEEEKHQEDLLERREAELELKKDAIRKIEMANAALSSDEKHKRRELSEVCHTQETMDRSEISTIDIGTAIARKREEISGIKDELSAWKKKREECSIIYDSMAEYSDYTYPEDYIAGYSFEIDIPVDELNNTKKTLLRENNQAALAEQKARRALEILLDDIARDKRFEEDIYQKQIAGMRAHTDDAAIVLKQVQVVLQTQHMQLDKLTADLSHAEKEKEGLISVIMDYVRDVHNEMDKIDSNSSITIGERSVKMLKIEIPSWEENADIYRQRIEDMVYEITMKGMAVLEQNRALSELLGLYVTTKYIYDTVVGITNIQVKLYKLEQQKGRQIAWSEVAKNSGGEGFVSAFVIVAALLYYMRKDDLDLFADKNESKVLIMDNPFAKAQSDHLLIPMMDIAAKANVQIIALTGIGGESIYNRFDNIYVLGLVSSNLRVGMQYLKSEHVKGSYERTMLSSRIEVLGQQELIF